MPRGERTAAMWNRFVSWGGYEGAKASITHLNRRGVAA